MNAVPGQAPVRPLDALEQLALSSLKSHDAREHIGQADDSIVALRTALNHFPPGALEPCLQTLASGRLDDARAQLALLEQSDPNLGPLLERARMGLRPPLDALFEALRSSL